MSINSIFSKLKESFNTRRSVDIDEIGLHIELETPTALEEIKITEAIKELEGSAWIEGLKKNSLAYSIKRIKMGDEDISLENDMELESEDGEKVSKYLYMLHQVESWPSSLRDKLFDAFSDLQMEVQKKVDDKMSFERFHFEESEEGEEDKQEETKDELKKVETKDE